MPGGGKKDWAGLAVAVVGGGWQRWEALDGQASAETLGDGTSGEGEGLQQGGKLKLNADPLSTYNSTHKPHYPLVFYPHLNLERPRQTHFRIRVNYFQKGFLVLEVEVVISSDYVTLFNERPSFAESTVCCACLCNFHVSHWVAGSVHRNKTISSAEVSFSNTVDKRKTVNRSQDWLLCRKERIETLKKKKKPFY